MVSCDSKKAALNSSSIRKFMDQVFNAKQSWLNKKKANNYDMKEAVTIFFIRKSLNQILNSLSLDQDKAVSSM